MSIIYNSRVMLQIVASPTDNFRGVIYDCNMFIKQATGSTAIKKELLGHKLLRHDECVSVTNNLRKTTTIEMGPFPVLAGMVLHN